MKIKTINAIEVIDSRGNPTVKTTVTLENGAKGDAVVPSGASTGTYEAVELRDGEKDRYGGLGVRTAVRNVNDTIFATLRGQDAKDQEKIDTAMINLDGTENKARLGANSILSVSLAVARAEANSENIPLYKYLTKFNPDFTGRFIMPVPMMNIINGGKHANWATDIQEYMILPVTAVSTTEAIRAGAEIYHSLKKTLAGKGYDTALGDEGGFAPKQMKDNSEPFELIAEAIAQTHYKLGSDIFLGIDAAASEFYSGGKYNLKKEGKTLSGEELSDFYLSLRDKYKLRSFEDIFAEDDWENFKKFTEKVNGAGQVVGDDLYVTNTKRLKKGISEKTTNSILIKVNQIGTLTETIHAVLDAREAGITSVISHRSGETEDAFIADLSVALGTGQIKTGAPARGERTAKYNRLIEIENELNGNSTYYSFPFR